MIRVVIFLFALLFFAACNNQPSNTQNTAIDSAAKKVEEKYLTNLGGEKQYVEITGASDKKPVLPFIHGGPGWPQTPQLLYFNANLTKAFTIATWDQRGCGLSYLNDSIAANITLEQIVATIISLKRKLTLCVVR